jgi:hypothetical protein
LGGDALTMPDRILAAADVYVALLQDRPRAARSATDAATALRGQVARGRLDADAVPGRRRPPGAAPTHAAGGARPARGAGAVASIPPGHDAEVIGDEPCVTVDLGEGDDADYARR